MRRRHESLSRISGPLDVCVIGGGATGAGCALDAQLRGLRTVLLEAGDFSSATSSASTKLVHGGVRYLQEAVADRDPGQYRVVKRALHERRIMLDNAPYLAHPLQFLVPCHTLWDSIYYGVGIKLYDWIAGGSNLFPSRYYSVQQSLERAPLLATQGLRGAIAYADGQFDDARFAMALVKSFAAAGGEAINYARVIGLDKNPRIAAVLVQDSLAGTQFSISARAFVNATGPFSDHVRQMANPDLPNRLRLSKGVHILLPLPEAMTDAILVPKTDDGRVIFAIPWLGRLLVGTTDTEVSGDDEMTVTRQEADFLLRQLNRYLSKPYSRDQIVSAFAGVRPLVASTDASSTQRLIRDHEVEVDARSGLISVLGGKWTTYRAMAQDGVDAVQRGLGIAVCEPRTRAYKLAGSDGYHPDFWQQLAAEYGMSSLTAQHLTEKFGAKAAEACGVAKGRPELWLPLVAGLAPIRAEVVYAVRQEMAMTLEDVLARRIGLQFFSWRAAIEAAPVAAGLMAPILGWSHADEQAEVSRYVNRICSAMQRIGLEPDTSMA